MFFGEDLDEYAPDGGCSTQCEICLLCGHVNVILRPIRTNNGYVPVSVLADALKVAPTNALTNL
ncbi:9813_t:CDS:2 [Paraglomus occultum]|uniref:9813_t:CDS:1 n=1 Tax=Paraglomus occultum TaxID=144539 RepID=A0A9N8VR84_9GLOM|nr:9813_t:CDS:2 [Paraglomus occultum]